MATSAWLLCSMHSKNLRTAQELHPNGSIFCHVCNLIQRGVLGTLEGRSPGNTGGITGKRRYEAQEIPWYHR